MRAFPARWTLALLITAAITILAGGLVAQLHTDAVASRSVDQELLDVRYLVNDSDRLAWVDAHAQPGLLPRPSMTH